MSERKPTVLIVDDEQEQRRLLRQALAELGIETAEAESAEQLLELVDRQKFDLVLLDVRLPGKSGLEVLPQLRVKCPNMAVILVTAYGHVRQAVQALKQGATDYLTKPLDLDELRTAVIEQLGRSNKDTMPELPPLPEYLCFRSKQMLHVLQTVAVVAPSNVPVLITGESGVGKELVARLVHDWSPRRERSFVAFNCAGISETLAESTLFGHVRGAFTGATEARSGLFRRASGGTLFLDEIGDLPLTVQAKLLRTLETGEVLPLGSDSPTQVDVRLVAATNCDLLRAVEDGKFREDLLYRLNVIELHVPPLRDRPEDILPLARHFARQFTGRDVRFSPATEHLLLSYHWPGNVRQLRNAVQRACLLAGSGVILPEHLPPQVQSLNRATADSKGRLSQVERATILATLAECNGNRTLAAKKLGISRRALLYKLRQIEAD